jgi:hypothetical protein
LRRHALQYRRALSVSDTEIVIGDNAWIGSRAILLPGARSGEGAIIGAAAVIEFEVPVFAIAAGQLRKDFRPRRAGGGDEGILCATHLARDPLGGHGRQVVSTLPERMDL